MLGSTSSSNATTTSELGFATTGTWKAVRVMSCECKQASTHTTYIMKVWSMNVGWGKGDWRVGKQHNNEGGHLTNCGAGRSLASCSGVGSEEGRWSLYGHLSVGLPLTLITTPTSRDQKQRKIVRASPKESPSKTLPKTMKCGHGSSSVAWSRIYVTGPSTKCYFNEFSIHAGRSSHMITYNK